MNKDVDFINYKYAFIRYIILWYIALTMCLVSVFRWAFDAFFFIAFGFLLFNALLSQPLYTEILLSKKLKHELIKLFTVDFCITFIGCMFFFPILVLKLFSFMWLCAISFEHDVKGSFR